MLRPSLVAAFTEALKKLGKPGEIRLVNENQPVTASMPVTGLPWKRRSAKYMTVYDWGESLQMDCPWCGDTRGRFFVSHAFGAYKARGKSKMYFGRLLAKCWNEECQSRPEVREWLRSINVPLENIDTVYQEAATTQPVQMRKGKGDVHACVNLPYPLLSLAHEEVPPEALKYFTDRHIDPNVAASAHYACYAPAGAIWRPRDPEAGIVTFKVPRLVLPVIQRRLLIYWQARRIDGLWESQQFCVKFRNPPVPKQAMFFNWDNALLHPLVIVCEGIADAMRVGINALGAMQKKWSAEQVRMLTLGWRRRGACLILADSDDPKALEAAQANAAALAQHRGSFTQGIVVCPSYPNKDPASMTDEELHAVLTQGVQALQPRPYDEDIELLDEINIEELE